MFFQFMPAVDYDFGKRDIKEVENIVIAVNPVDDIYSNRYFDTKIIGDETPEAISESLYRDPAYYWNLLYVNRVVNPFTEWVKTSEELEEFCMIKYKTKDILFAPRYFIDVRDGQILVGIEEDKIYKYMEDNDGELPVYIQKVTNYEHERRENEKLRSIRYVPESSLLAFNDVFETAMRINSGENR